MLALHTKVLLVQLMGELIANVYLCKIKNWMLLIHFVILELPSVMEVVLILVLSRDFDLRCANFRNSCQL